MKVRPMDIYGLIGALKSQYMYQNSKLRKAKFTKDIKCYEFDIIKPDDVLFLLVEELEEAIKQLENTTSSSNVSLKIKIEKNKNMNSEYENTQEICDIKMPPL